ncbi:tRNA (N(6)-L-threonylcarbamoyladenosine(37)-C(2))-methylthiotransferase MtaB [Dehalococcoidia bacterium]|nr:tRNA (N(6)-L-threonylcarbamoyladenosine(37)-C(2))-methylthiotransferase MtaB [Dehalococcoidia bacterium]MCL0073659.1 tRNA (N(6)-L-threonylcarbamoyladenosine(37)-C(2))-methylthiotransferase MtaB [Dehalococcoidia bacterium]
MNTTEGEDPEYINGARPTVALQTVGCKLNQAESESLACKFLNAGFGVVAPDQKPDVYILNTCTVTHISDRKCRHHLRSFRRLNPRALVLATGCYVDRDAAGVCVEGVDLAVGNTDKDRLVEIVAGRLGSRNISVRGPLGTPNFLTRSLVKIQEGCNQCCSYCIVPHVRGRERSVPAGEVISEVRDKAGRGYQEIVLTGTRIGAYDGAGGLAGLVRRILDDTAISRLRLSSLQPGELSTSFIDLWRDSGRICRHLHLALQSGSDSVLKRMGRRYSTSEYEETVNLVREAMPDIAITTDVIVGFPGESEEEFEESHRFCERTGFAGLHIFPYSARPGTPAARMSGKVPEKIKKARSRIMIDLASRSAREFRRRFSGRTMPVLWEEQKRERLWIGHTGNYIKVIARSDEPLRGCLIETKLGGGYEDALWGDM